MNIISDGTIYQLIYSIFQLIYSIYQKRLVVTLVDIRN